MKPAENFIFTPTTRHRYSYRGVFVQSSTHGSVYIPVEHFRFSRANRSGSVTGFPNREYRNPPLRIRNPDTFRPTAHTPPIGHSINNTSSSKMSDSIRPIFSRQIALVHCSVSRVEKR